MKYTHRYIARIILEAETPLFMGSGETSLLKDALVQKDHFGFPMIQGTSLTGVLRHALDNDEAKWNDFFGYQEKDEGSGSKVKISSAYLILDDNQIAEGLSLTDSQSSLLDYFDELPTRQHVRISDKGAQVAQGLFDNEVVYQGCQFAFEMEVKGNKNDNDQWNALLNQLNSPLFRLGQGTRNGYGKLKVVSKYVKSFDLTNEEDFDTYLNFDPSLNANIEFVDVKDSDSSSSDSNDFIYYELKLKPDSFFIFGAGYGDKEVNATPLKENVVQYNEGKMTMVEKNVIPASSIKGAISHRTCFHYNKLQKAFADEGNGTKGIKNKAVHELFGAEAGDKIVKAKQGRVIINDMYFDDTSKNKIFNHVAIDRFTGGAMDGALFSEKVSQKDELKIDIWVDSSQVDETVISAFENCLLDISNGLLPLGGMTTKGHGIFTGDVFRNEDKIEKYVIS